MHTIYHVTKESHGPLSVPEVDLKTVQRLVGGWIQEWPRAIQPPGLPEGLTVYVDEEGLIKELDPVFKPHSFDGIVLGPMVITRTDYTGADIGLTASDLVAVTQWVRDNYMGGM